MKKNVGLLIHTLTGGGAERVVSRLSHILGDKYNVFVILFEEKFMEYKINGTIINLGIPAVNNNFILKCILPFRRAKKLKQIKKDKKLDVVISFLQSPNFVNVLSHCPGCKTVVSVRNYCEPSFITRVIQKITYKKADIIIPVSKLIEENLINNYKIKRAKIHTIYNPYDLCEINELALKPIEKEFLQFILNSKTFISMGRFTYQKGFWHLIKAFKLVRDKYSYAKLVIMGHDEYGGLLQKLIDKFDLNSSVLLMDFNENPFKYLASCDIYILSSQYEGFPNALIEAMACGCAVVAADCKSGPREILYDEPDIHKKCKGNELANYGILTERLDTKMNFDCNVIHDSEIKLANAMMMYLENEALLLDYSQKAMLRARDFSYERCKKEYEEVIGQ